MKRILSPIFALLLLGMAPAPAPADGRPHDALAVTPVSAEDQTMNAAIAQAQRTLPDFLRLLANPPAGSTGYAIKFPLGGYEHIWVEDVRLEGQVLVGTLANYPEQAGYSFGQNVRVPLAQVSDWSYRDAKGVMQGHFTTRVLLATMPKDEAAQVREALGWTQ